MDEYTIAALEIVKAQASSLSMTEDEIVSMVKAVAGGIVAVSSGQIATIDADATAPTMDPKKAIKETSIVCLECGKSFKMITRKHLASHGLTAEEYKDKHISFNYLALGSVQTEMFSAAFPKFKAQTKPQEMAKFITEFAHNGHLVMNGKVIPVSKSNP